MHFGLLPYCRKIALLIGDSYKVGLVYGLVSLTTCAAGEYMAEAGKPIPAIISVSGSCILPQRNGV